MRGVWLTHRWKRENGVAYDQIKEFAKTAIEHYNGVLNTIYLYGDFFILIGSIDGKGGF